MKNENENALHDARYKFYCALTIENEAFRARISAYRMWLSTLNHPIPIGGLRDDSAMQEWIDAVGKDYFAQQKMDWYLREEHKITKGKKCISLEESDAIDALREKVLPPYPYHGPLTKILEEFITDRPIDEHDFTFIIKYALMEKVVYTPSIVRAIFKQNDKDELDLFVQIQPHTRLHHLKKAWKMVSDMQKMLLGYRERSRPSPSIHDQSDGVSPDAERMRKNRRKKILSKANG